MSLSIPFTRKQEKFFRKATHKSETGRARESKRIKERTKKEEQLVELAKHSAELESSAPRQKTSEYQEGRDEPERPSDEENNRSKEDKDDTDPINEGFSLFEESEREHESRSWHQRSVQHACEQTVMVHTEPKPGQTYGLRIKLEKEETGGGMTLRQQVKEKDLSQGSRGQDAPPGGQRTPE